MIHVTVFSLPKNCTGMRWICKQLAWLAHQWYPPAVPAGEAPTPAMGPAAAHAAVATDKMTAEMKQTPALALVGGCVSFIPGFSAYYLCVMANCCGHAYYFFVVCVMQVHLSAVFQPSHCGTRWVKFDFVHTFKNC